MRLIVNKKYVKYTVEKSTVKSTLSTTDSEKYKRNVIVEGFSLSRESVAEGVDCIKNGLTDFIVGQTGLQNKCYLWLFIQI